MRAEESCTPGPGNLLWEGESTLHWAPVLTGAAHQGQLEHSGGLRLLSLVEERHALSAPLRPNTKTAVKQICQQWEVCQRGGDQGALSREENSTVRRLQKPATKCSIVRTGSSTLWRHSPVHPLHLGHWAQQRLALLTGRQRVDNSSLAFPALPQHNWPDASGSHLKSSPLVPLVQPQYPTACPPSPAHNSAVVCHC